MDNWEFKIGDIIKSKKNCGLFGRISQVCENEVVIEQNGFLIRLCKSDIERAAGIATRSTKTTRISIKLHNTDTFSEEIDLHGYTKYDAIEALSKFIDKAQALGHTHVKIIHGKGSGILRTEVRNLLAQDPRIKQILVNNILFKGGSGVTWAELM